MKRIDNEKIKELAKTLSEEISTETRIEIAINLISLNKLSDSEISSATELPLEKIAHIHLLYQQFSES